VEWRSRSIVLSGDHLNDPKTLEKLVKDKVMTRERANMLNEMPLQDCDLLLHESGAPPIHTTLEVLEALPEEVKARMYVVHTSNLPEDSTLRVAPTGTAGTVRISETVPGYVLPQNKALTPNPTPEQRRSSLLPADSILQPVSRSSIAANASSVYSPHGAFASMMDLEGRRAQLTRSETKGINAERTSNSSTLSLRETSSSDSWFMLSLLYNLPFVSDLAYASVMELLELAQIMTYVKGSTVLKKEERRDHLVMVWEGEIVECHTHDQDAREPVTFHAGDWTGPLTFQPNVDQSCEASSASKRRIIANSPGGVKIIKIAVSEFKFVLGTGSQLYSKFQEVRRIEKGLPASDR